MSAVVRPPRPPSGATTVSVDDVYVLAERERVRSSYRTRRHVVEQALKNTCKGDNSSRPYSSASRPFSTRLSLGSSQCQRSRMTSANSTHKPNTPDASDTETLAQSCEIMGPRICHECQKFKSREISRERTSASLKHVNNTQQNIATSAIVRRLYPTMSNAEIHSKIARGEISRSYLPRALQSNSSTDSQEEDEMQDINESGNTVTDTTIFAIAKIKQRFKNKGEPTTPLYFHNIRDLNFKIMSGRVPRGLGFDNKPKWMDNDDTRRRSSTESLFPVFVSPRKVTMYKEPSYKSYFAPPLLPRENQKPEPSFFAGSNFEYKLPERLPDKLVFVDSLKARVNSAASISSAVSDFTFDTTDGEKDVTE